MRVNGSVSGDLQAILDQAKGEVAAALRSGMAAAGASVQADLRSQTQSAGLGGGLERAWQRKDYPNPEKPLAPAALVYSKSVVLHRVFTEGASIRAARSRYLAIPTKEAEALGYARTDRSRKGGGIPGGQQRRASQVYALIARLGAKNIRIEPAKGGRRVVIYTPPAGRGKGHTVRGRGGGSLGFQRGRGVVMFVLVPHVSLRSRIDFAAARGRAAATLEAAISEAMGR